MIVLTFVLVFAAGVQLRIDTDVWWHLRAGAYTLQHGVIRADPFSFTKAGEAWVDHSWGSEVVLHYVWSAGGYGALSMAMGVLCLACAGLVYAMCWGGTYLRCGAVGFASLTASIFWSPRPHMFSYVLCALVLYVLFLRRHRGIDALWALPLIMAVWANLHGGFAVGLLLIGGTLIGELLERRIPLDGRGSLTPAALRRLAVFGGLSLVAVCINPYGPRLLAVPFETGGSSYVRLIEEWMPPDLRVPSYWPFAIALVVLVLSIGASPVRVGWSDGLLVSCATLLAMLAGRNVALFMIVATPVITYHLHALCEERGWGVRTLRTASAPVVAANVALIAVALGVVVSRASDSVRDSAFQSAARAALPVGAVEYLQEHGVRGRLFNSYDWGGYLIHSLPDVKVFVDGRSDLYGDFLVDPYLRIAEAQPGWAEQLDRYEIETALVTRTGGLANVLARDAEWRWAYSDDVAIVFERRTSRSTR
jgi:hypothetical protein